MTQVSRLIITTGDTDGIGLEVACKALAISMRRNYQALLWVSRETPAAYLKKTLRPLKSNIKNIVTDLETAMSLPAKAGEVILIFSDLPPANWIEPSATACLADPLRRALVTGPLSKPAILQSGLRDVGHTDILQRVCGGVPVYMAFKGNKFSVVLATGHCALKDVEKKLSTSKLDHILELLSNEGVSLKGRRKSKPIGVLGLNPHAGDKGIIGSYEKEIQNPWIKKTLQKGFAVEGPLVPDVAFQPHLWKKYSFYIALYHDQGLIPFKLVHGFAGAHFTLGLPLVRTSVDHGTAIDLWGKNCADPSSMKEALELAENRLKNWQLRARN